MSAKNVAFAGDARDLGPGLNILADAVEVTLGPRDRNVLIHQGRARGAAERGVRRFAGAHPPQVLKAERPRSPARER